jgi:hypothetical protein
MLTIAIKTWIHSDVPTKKPSLADVFLTSLDPLSGTELTELNPSSPFFQRMSQLHLYLINIGSQPEVRSTSILSSYPPVPSAAEIAFDPSANRGLSTTGSFLQRPPTPGVETVNKSIVLSEAQRITAEEARERQLFALFQSEPSLKGLCFPAVTQKGGCPFPDCRFCKQSSKQLFSRDKNECETAALRVVGHSVS